MLSWGASSLHRAVDWLHVRLGRIFRRSIDVFRQTYSPTTPVGGVRGLVKGSLATEAVPSGVLRQYLQHCFDLLGSGWVCVRYGMQCRGLDGHRYDREPRIEPDSAGRWLVSRVNRANLREAQRIWRLIDGEYEAIDWQLDFKSGYRWAACTWYRAVRFGNSLGADVKVPWELSRMQHLPQLAFAYLEALRSEQDAARIPLEFRNQVLDFVATNPPRFGVNWACTMDVAIRVSNWLVAHDLLRAAGVVFDAAFESVFARSVYEHAKHIIENREWQRGIRGNHYLANIAGLLFAAAHLPRDRETDAWLAFAIQELINEVDHQFHQDGANFEGSTTYHRLAAEMVVYATSVTLGLPEDKQRALLEYDYRILRGRPSLQPAPLRLYKVPEKEGQPSKEESPFPGWYFQRLQNMADFVADITKPDGHIPQVGDNDSGRFLKLAPSYSLLTVRAAKSIYANLDAYLELPEEAEYWMEDHLDARHLSGAIAGVVNAQDCGLATSQASTVPSGRRDGRLVDKCLVSLLAGGRAVVHRRIHGSASRDGQCAVIGCVTEFANLRKRVDAVEPHRRRTTTFSVTEGDLRQNVTLAAYPNFGLYLLRSPRLYLAFRSSMGYVGRPSGHLHHDQLAVELTIDGEDVIQDPGTYVYTAIPSERNRYRSVHAHFTPWGWEDEPARLNGGLFYMPDPPSAELRYFGPEGMAAVMNVRERSVARLIVLQSCEIAIIDSILKGDGAYPEGAATARVPVTIGYGIRLRGKA